MTGPRSQYHNFLASSIGTYRHPGHKTAPGWLAIASLSVLLMMLLAGDAAAQSQTPQAGSQPEGVNAGGFVVHQSIEVGYRFSDQVGSTNMYDTLVNLQQGPRLFDQTLSMQSPTHNGFLFDNLFVSSFGWGGDPDNALRVRADKGKWYDFQGSFRRDQNFFDYNLLANPLIRHPRRPIFRLRNPLTCSQPCGA